MDGLMWVLVALAIVGFVGICSIVTVVLVLRALYRRIRRSRAVNGTVLRTRANLSWGPQRKVLALRVRLDDALASGQAAVGLAGRGDGPRGELPRLFRRIQTESVTLDAQLRLLESETDAAVLAAELPRANGRVDQVVGLVRRLRSAVGAGLGGLSEETLTTLQADVDREVAALHAGMQELQDLQRNDAYFEPTRQPSSDRLDLRNKGATS